MPSDLIYREDAKFFVRHACYKKINPIDYLDEVPAADVRPVVRGKWIDVSPAHIKVFRCDQCGEETTDTCLDKPRANFCPNCGADMRGPNLDTAKGDNHG